MEKVAYFYAYEVRTPTVGTVRASGVFKVKPDIEQKGNIYGVAVSLAEESARERFGKEMEIVVTLTALNQI